MDFHVMIERTLVVIKPDGVQRALIGEVIRRFEKIGLKVVGIKMAKISEIFAKKHYTKDISKRRGELVRINLIKFITEGPVVAFVLEGVHAIETARKLVGDTEPKSAKPGTIRGDFSHISYAYADKKKMAVRNVIHSSANIKEANHEIRLWFKINEILSYRSVHDAHL
jgi:nucleoside-diphosphate kinase